MRISDWSSDVCSSDLIPELPVPSVTLFHEMSHAYNGVNGTFLPGTYTGPGPDSPTPTRQIPNAERQAVGLETTADPYEFGSGSGPNTHTPPAPTATGPRGRKSAGEGRRVEGSVG